MYVYIYVYIYISYISAVAILAQVHHAEARFRPDRRCRCTHCVCCAGFQNLQQN